MESTLSLSFFFACVFVLVFLLVDEVNLVVILSFMNLPNRPDEVNHRTSSLLLPLSFHCILLEEMDKSA